MPLAYTSEGGPGLGLGRLTHRREHFYPWKRVQAAPRTIPKWREVDRVEVPRIPSLLPLYAHSLRGGRFTLL